MILFRAKMAFVGGDFEVPGLHGAYSARISRGNRAGPWKKRRPDVLRSLA
jgi:hypothetical protein